MTETTLYLIRHGETEYNRRRIMQGRRIDCPLNEAGRRQAAALASRFAEVPLEALYSSSLRRAVETAGHIAAEHEALEVRRLADLDEMSWGVYEGEPRSARLGAALETMYAHWERGAFNVPVEGGESILGVQARGLRAIHGIAEGHAGETVAVVTHGRMLRVMLASLLEGYGLARMHDIDHANTSVNQLTYRNGRFTASLLNCTEHLDLQALRAVE